MNKIWGHGRQSGGYSYQPFVNDFTAICNSHREDGRALAFAFLLYDFRDAAVRKVLEDTAYWDALDAFAGDTLTVFSFDWETMNDPPQITESRAMFSVAGTRRNAYSPLWQYFGFSTPPQSPAVLFFQVVGEEITDSMIVQIRSDRVEDTFAEIRDLLKAVGAATSRVSPENRGNSREVFALIKGALEVRAEKLSIARAMQGARSVLPFLKLVAG